MAELGELVKIEITKPLPETGAVDTIYKIEGSAKMFDAVGALPWVYAEVRRKEWWKPEFIEEVSYERGFPIPVTGDFSIDVKPKKKSDYEVTVVATPAPLSLPVVGVFPVVGKSDMMKIRVAEAVEVWEMVEEVLDIVIEAGPEIGLWEMVEEVGRIVIEVGPEVALWEMAEEVLNILVEPKPVEPALWEMVEEVYGIVVQAVPEIIAWEMVEEVANIVVRAVAPPAEYTLEVTIEPPGAGHVLISSKAPYSVGEVLTLVATPYPGYKFDHWGGWPPYPGVGSTSSTLKITMTADWWVVAAFREVAAPPPPPPECTPGDRKCVYRALYVCSGEGRWVLFESPSDECPYP